jgi:hypothetical protein
VLGGDEENDCPEKSQPRGDLIPFHTIDLPAVLRVSVPTLTFASEFSLN